jgi:hypothetical protein
LGVLKDGSHLCRDIQKQGMLKEALSGPSQLLENWLCSERASLRKKTVSFKKISGVTGNFG